ncbi:HAD superfamily hydrolase (TIGR01509 family) [Litoreibacter ponti]|uniref:HAD superfamily hydrolase (TIGR01509 family) n=1 Tax=Litoreibacter ponti TaxID=1510457 RepID=A0A2T6BDE1_9RHOB|nr:HAD-IA family hydrolase [Litoreibacter ponti]PTX54081.1 HAD superfamily hydrolase (TIGR01509 family) [Litoreibacter ponti]
MIPVPPKAILFGSIGTIVETSHIQRDAFNAAFKEADLNWEWEEDEYRAMLGVPGGKGRIQRYADEHGVKVDVDALHRRKSEIFQEKIALGLELRPGVAAVIYAAQEADVKLGFVTTTSQANIRAIFDGLGSTVTRDMFDFVGAAVMVGVGKPAPDIYRHALEVLNLDASDAIAIEDTPPAAEAAIRAGIETLAFPGAYVDAPFGGVYDTTDHLTPEAFGLEPGLKLAS